MVGREDEQVEELRDAGPREPQPARHGGPVGDVAPVDGPLQVVREGEHLGDLGGPAHGLGLRWRRRHREHHATLLADPMERVVADAKSSTSTSPVFFSARSSVCSASLTPPPSRSR